MITRSSNIITLIRNVSSQVDSQTISLEEIPANFESEVFPDYIRGEFVLENYPQVIEGKEIVYSQQITSNGVTWRLKVYPNGNGQSKGTCLSVFLEMVKGSCTPGRYNYKFEMINHLNSENTMTREYTSEFDVSECWGYNKFYPTEGVITEGFVDESNRVKLLFYVRASLYSQHCSDQVNYIKKLESKITSLKSKLLLNDVRFSEDEADEAEKEQNLDEYEQVDDLPVNESAIEQEDYSDPDEGFKSMRSQIKKSNQQSSRKQLIQEIEVAKEEISKIDSDDHVPNVHLETEERKHIIQDDNSDISGELESQIDRFKREFDKNRISQDFIPSERDEVGSINVSASENDNESSSNQNKNNFNEFLKEMNETENHLKRLKIFNNSFKGEMKTKFTGYENNSDDSYNGNYEVNHEEIDSPSSEGNLSRDEENKVEDQFVQDSIKKHMLEVSPDSPLQRLSRRAKKDEEFNDLMFRDVINEYGDTSQNYSLMGDHIDSAHNEYTASDKKAKHMRFTPESKPSSRKATWKKRSPREDS